MEQILLSRSLGRPHHNQKRIFGCSPFFLVTGAHPVLPFDIVEATWLVKLPDRVLTTEELIGYRARALAKHRDTVEGNACSGF